MGGILVKNATENISIKDDKVTINRKDLYCLARLLQSAITRNGPEKEFNGCQYCKIPCHNYGRGGRVEKRLRDLTGVNFSFILLAMADLQKEHPIKYETEF